MLSSWWLVWLRRNGKVDRKGDIINICNIRSQMQPSKYFLKCLEEKKTDRSDPSLKSFFQMISKFLQTCLNFSLSEAEFQESKKFINQVGIQKFDYLNCWSRAIKKQLTAYSSIIEATLKLHEQSSSKNDNPQNETNLRKMEKIVRAALGKLQLLIKLIVNVIEEYAKMNLWCACQRKECSSRFKAEVFAKNIQHYFLHTKQIKWAVVKLYKARLLQVTLYEFRYSTQLDYFEMSEDMECDILSVQRNEKGIETLEEKAKKTQKLLSKMKIVDKQRQRCKVEAQWLRKMRKKLIKFLQQQK